MLFRDKLKALRESAGVTQEGLAVAAGVSVGNVRNYEQGIRLPSFPAVVKLAKALGTDCTSFVGCEDVAGAGVEGKPAAKKPKKGKRK